MPWHVNEFMCEGVIGTVFLPNVTMKNHAPHYLNSGFGNFQNLEVV